MRPFCNSESVRVHIRVRISSRQIILQQHSKMNIDFHLQLMHTMIKIFHSSRNQSAIHTVQTPQIKGSKLFLWVGFFVLFCSFFHAFVWTFQIVCWLHLNLCRHSNPNWISVHSQSHSPHITLMGNDSATTGSDRSGSCCEFLDLPQLLEHTGKK